MEKIKNRLMCVLLILCSLTVFSCGDDDDGDDEGGTGSSKDLVGTWEATYQEAYYIDENGKKEYDNETYAPGELVVIFRADGTGTVTEDGGEPDEVFNWSYSGNVLKVKEIGTTESRSAKILSITSTSFVMEESEKYPSGEEDYAKTTYRRVK